MYVCTCMQGGDTACTYVHVCREGTQHVRMYMHAGNTTCTYMHAGNTVRTYIPGISISGLSSLLRKNCLFSRSSSFSLWNTTDWRGGKGRGGGEGGKGEGRGGEGGSGGGEGKGGERGGEGRGGEGRGGEEEEEDSHHIQINLSLDKLVFLVEQSEPLLHKLLLLLLVSLRHGYSDVQLDVLGPILQVLGPSLQGQQFRLHVLTLSHQQILRGRGTTERRCSKGYMYTCTCMHMYMYAHAHIHVCTCTYAHACYVPGKCLRYADSKQMGSI